MNDMIICIGRRYGSGGREIGEKAGGAAGVTCYDKAAQAGGEGRRRSPGEVGAAG